MSFTGGISFFDASISLFDSGSSAVASSNTSDRNLPLGTNNVFKWESSGSNDLTTETYTVTLSSAVEISRLFLIGHNFKKFQVKYGASLDFANVVGLDSYSDNKIDITGFSRNTAYFEFDAVTTDTIILTVDTAQVVDAEKFLTQFIVTNEIGTLTGYPKLDSVRIDENARAIRAISGRNHVKKAYKSASFKLALNRYPNQADVDILDGLFDRNTSFLTWICGGLPDQFTLSQRGFLVENVYNMEIFKPMKNSHDKNVYLMGVNQSYSFIEVV